MHRTGTRRALAALAALVVVVTACGGDDSGTTTTAAEVTSTEAPAETEPPVETEPPETTVPDEDPGVHRVPEEYDTIQAAVDAAQPGDLVLIGPGTYHEAVDVTTDELTIRGLDRNEVILDGQFELDNGIRVVAANGVAIENMTAMNYTRNGFFWTGGDGYRGSYLTVMRTGRYGVYAFDIANGIFEHIYASGVPDGGIYIGQCYPCNAIVRNVVSEWNGLGYSGTNSGGDLYIVESVFRNNRVGIVPSSGSYELCYPQRQTTIVGNVVHSNNNGETATISWGLLAMGNGIIAPGGIGNVIERNLVYDHDRTGIGLIPLPEEDATDLPPPEEDWDRPCRETRDDPLADPADIPALLLWQPYDNRVVGNVVSDSREADIALASVEQDLAELRNCFSGNTFGTTAPFELETLAPCDGEGEGDWAAGDLQVIRWLPEVDTRPPSADWTTVDLPDPGPQQNMPDAATAPARPAVDLDLTIDLDAIQVPARPS